MQNGVLFGIAIVLLMLSGYAHRQLALFTRSSSNILISRSLLLIVGILFGWISARDQAGSVNTLLRFLIGFGMVHVPAAVILFIKGQRGAGKS